MPLTLPCLVLPPTTCAVCSLTRRVSSVLALKGVCLAHDLTPYVDHFSLSVSQPILGGTLHCRLCASPLVSVRECCLCLSPFCERPTRHGIRRQNGSVHQAQIQKNGSLSLLTAWVRDSYIPRLIIRFSLQGMYILTTVFREGGTH